MICPESKGKSAINLLKMVLDVLRLQQMLKNKEHWDGVSFKNTTFKKPKDLKELWNVKTCFRSCRCEVIL